MLNPDTLVVCHCYAGDRQQVLDLLPVYEHHEAPVVIISPTDSPVKNIGPHHTREAGLVEYYGQKSWDRQHAQLKLLVEEYPHSWFLLNDSDSFVLSAKIPDYLYHDKNCVWSNEVDDFRCLPEWHKQFPPDTYHVGFDKVAMQPPYWLHREALKKIVDASAGMIACPTTPFIDWWWIPACKLAGVPHRRFHHCASCETVTELGVAVMSECVSLRDAIFIHSIKKASVKDHLVALYRAKHNIKPKNHY